MYPNQGFPGQYPPNTVPFGAGFPPKNPQAGFVMQQAPPKPPQQEFGMPQAPYGQQPPIPNYEQAPQMPAYGAPSQTPYGQAPQMTSYGQQPPMPNYGQAPYGQVPQMSAYEAPSQPPFQAPQMPNYEQQPSLQLNEAPKVVKTGRPTVTPALNFDALKDASILRKAMKGFGTDQNAIINVLCRRSCEQRIEIANAFKTAYGKDLIEDIRSETSGNFENLLVALLTPNVDYYCNELFRAIDGIGTDEDALIEIMCTVSNQEIRDIGLMYQKKFGQILETHLRGDTSGCMKRLMTSLSAGNRDESMITDENAARQDAQALKTAGVDRFGTDESEFNRILCSRNYDQIKLVCQEYEKLTGNPLENDIKREFSGDIKDALLAIVCYANNSAEFFARRLHKSMAGLGTNDRSLIRLCVTRCEVDMEDVKDSFLRLYEKSLKSFIKGDTSGHYKNALFTLCGESR